MKSSFHLGRIAGIKLGAHWSVFAIAALIAWTLAALVLPDLQPGYDTASYWAVGVVVAIVFFLSLVAHEFGHSLVARRQGIAVDEITLWLLGGVSKLRSDSRTAGDEFRMAVVGPLISLGLGFVFGTVAGLADALHAPALVVAGLVWLAATNVLLGVFNLIPAFPLDGGRVLRSILWYRSGNRLRATLTAARAGQILGYALVGLGFLEFFFGGVSGLWLVLLGWFITQAAKNEAGVVVQNELLAGARVRDIMSGAPITVPSDLSVEDLVDRYVLGSRHSAYPVLGPDGRPAGLVTLDSVRRVSPPLRSTTSVGTAMEALADVTTVRPDDMVTDALERMMRAGSRRALVLESDHLVGLLSTTDITRALDARSVARAPKPQDVPPLFRAPR